MCAGLLTEVYIIFLCIIIRYSNIAVLLYISVCVYASFLNLYMPVLFKRAVFTSVPVLMLKAIALQLQRRHYFLQQFLSFANVTFIFYPIGFMSVSFTFISSSLPSLFITFFTFFFLFLVSHACKLFYYII